MRGLKLFVFLVVSSLASPAWAQQSVLPEGGGAPGQAYREFMKASAALDWRALHRVTTPAFFAGLTQELLTSASQIPEGAEILLSGTRQGARAELKVEIRLHPSPGVTRSSTSRAVMVLDNTQWKAADDERDGAASPLAFEAAETVRRMRELGGYLDGRKFEAGVYPKAATATELARGLTSKSFPHPYATDAWGNPLVYRLHETQKAYVLLSYGRDGKPEAGRYDAKGVPKAFVKEETVEPDADIVMTVGASFLRYPRGAIIN